MSNVVAFPGVILTERETGPQPPSRPPVTFKPCPRCARHRSGRTTAK